MICQFHMVFDDPCQFYMVVGGPCQFYLIYKLHFPPHGALRFWRGISWRGADGIARSQDWLIVSVGTTCGLSSACQVWLISMQVNLIQLWLTGDSHRWVTDPPLQYRTLPISLASRNTESQP